MSGFFSGASRVTTDTFVPTVVGTSTAGTGTYTTQTGTYAKVDSLVFFRLRLAWTAHTMTGNMKLAGLPFTAAAGNSYPVDLYLVSGLTWSNTLQAAVAAETTEVVLTTVASAGGATSLTGDTAADIVVAGCYLV